MSRKEVKVFNPHTKESFDLNDLLTVKEVSKIFSVTMTTVYNWLGKIKDNKFYFNGKFPNAFKIEKEIYIPIKDVTNYTMSKTTIETYERSNNE